MTLDDALALERAVWDALVAGDAAADEASLAADFLGVYPSGFAERACHVGQLDDGPSVAAYRIEDARLDVIAEDAFLIGYRAVFARAKSPAEEEAMYVSSLWRLRDGRWLNTFSQDTPEA
ncbi:MAG: nuclear transport factor 2 family protein [Pseudomonadota bacterium]